ncbi:sugar phosphate isomerase/epimerase family protein [Dankookia rubra]|uniref:sugar phosphate isomerase/epimerase family protein n=1 Tax=Dankookia rubra TaxID=1442381 RepID=UPI0019D581F9|nr:sugar phosphate isomerase/epimerase family protein [Dankookia rubra]
MSTTLGDTPEPAAAASILSPSPRPSGGLRFAYNTNGAANHRLSDAIALIAVAGYDGVALTLDHHHLDPLEDGWVQRTEALARDLHARSLGCVIETGARFLLDPRRKHEPTLLTPHAEGRARRVAFLQRAVDIGQILGAEAVSFWAGVPLPGVDRGEAAEWLVEGVEQVLDHAARRGVTAALEPEPGMLVETLDDWSLLQARLPQLKLALDLGHCLVTQEREPAAAVGEFAAQLGTVAIEDMRRGDHTHLPFGEGDMDIPACLDALEAIGFARLVCVELSRESHRADRMIPQSLDWLLRCREERTA